MGRSANRKAALGRDDRAPPPATASKTGAGADVTFTVLSVSNHPSIGDAKVTGLVTHVEGSGGIGLPSYEPGTAIIPGVLLTGTGGYVSDKFANRKTQLGDVGATLFDLSATSTTESKLPRIVPGMTLKLPGAIVTGAFPYVKGPQLKGTLPPPPLSGAVLRLELAGLSVKVVRASVDLQTRNVAIAANIFGLGNEMSQTSADDGAADPVKAAIAQICRTTQEQAEKAVGLLSATATKGDADFNSDLSRLCAEMKSELAMGAQEHETGYMLPEETGPKLIFELCPLSTKPVAAVWSDDNVADPDLDPLEFPAANSVGTLWENDTVLPEFSGVVGWIPGHYRPPEATPPSVKKNYKPITSKPAGIGANGPYGPFQYYEAPITLRVALKDQPDVFTDETHMVKVDFPHSPVMFGVKGLENVGKAMEGLLPFCPAVVMARFPQGHGATPVCRANQKKEYAYFNSAMQLCAVDLISGLLHEGLVVEDFKDSLAALRPSFSHMKHEPQTLALATCGFVCLNEAIDYFSIAKVEDDVKAVNRQLGQLGRTETAVVKLVEFGTTPADHKDLVADGVFGRNTDNLFYLVIDLVAAAEAEESDDERTEEVEEPPAKVQKTTPKKPVKPAAKAKQGKP